MTIASTDVTPDIPVPSEHDWTPFASPGSVCLAPGSGGSGVLGLKRVGNGVGNESMKERRGYFRRVEESINRDVTINEI